MHTLLSAQVVHLANKLSWARLCFADGAPAQGDFALSSSPLLLPGKTVEVLGGGSSARTTLFQGIVVSHALRMRELGASQLVIECRHAATRLTASRSGRYFHDKSDSDAVGELLALHGVEGEVEATSLTHEHLVQYDCSDWDFVLARATANGQVLLARGGALDVRTPSLDGEPVLELAHGATLLELDLELDARSQPEQVVTTSWDPVRQKRLESPAEEPAWTEPGNLGPDALAEALGNGRLELCQGEVPEAEARAHADAEWRYARVGRVQGRLVCEGVGVVQPGDVIRLSGVGTRFSGKAYVTGVRHDQSSALGWKTQLQIGTLPRLPQGAGVSAPRAGGLLPGVIGLQPGVVVGNEDGRGEYRVRVRLPLVDADDAGTWARVATLDAGAGRGTFFRPEVDDEVVVGFVNGDPRHAVVLGMLHSSARRAPLEPSADNDQKGYRSRNGLELMFDEGAREIRLSTPRGNQLRISEQDGGLALRDEHGNSLVMDAQGVTLESATSLTLRAATEVVIEAGSALALSAGTELKAEGSSGAKLTSMAVTEIQGSLVKIN